MGQLQQLDAFLNVGLVGSLVRRDVAQEAVLLRAPPGRLAVEERRVNPETTNRMKLTLDHTQRLNLHALLGAQRADVGSIRAIWGLQDRVALDITEEKDVELKREMVAGHPGRLSAGLMVE